MRPRVLLLSQEVHPIPPRKGAAVEQWIDAVAHRLDAFEPHIVSVPHPDLPDDQRVGSVRYHRIHVGRVYNRLFRKITRLDPYSYLDRVVRYARSVAPAIVHLHNAPQFVLGIARGLPAARLILHMHNEKEPRFDAALDCLAGCSRYIVEWYRRKGVRARRFVVLPNGVDVNVFRPKWEQAPVGAALKARFAIPEHRFVVLYVGRISPEKGVDLLVEAFRHLDQARFHLVLVGEWPKGSASTSERVAYAERLQRELVGLNTTVIDTLAPDRVHEAYQLGDVVVVPSRFEEPFSMTAIEAMASGVPVLALRKGGMAEYMVDRENAVVLPPATPATELAARLRELAASKELLDGVARRARAFVVGRFTWEQVVKETQALYTTVLDSEPGFP